METKPIQTEKPETILAMNGIVLEKPEAMVRQVGIYLQEITRKGNEITLKGVKTISGGEPLTVKTSLRSIQYLNSKSVKRLHPFNKTAFERFITQTEGTSETLKPAYTFMVNALVHNETGIGYALTFKKLVALNSQIFNAYLKGETPRTHKELFPFDMGIIQIATKNGLVKVNFGVLNGNSGIKLTNTVGVAIGVSYKHLPNSVVGMCAQLKTLISSEAIQLAPNAEIAAQILESFKGTSM